LVSSITMMFKSMNASTHMGSPRLNSSPSMIDLYDGQLPVSADGAILVMHFTAFLTAVDSLLSAGRSNAPIRVLTSMTLVVPAVANVLNDVRSHSRWYSDAKGVHTLEERIEATLSNLVAASTTRATSFFHSELV